MFLGKANLGPFRDSALYEYSTLFQNFNNDPKCQEAFKTATAIGFFSQSTNVSVCMDSLKLLPSTVQLEGMYFMLAMLCYFAVLCCDGAALCCAALSQPLPCCTVFLPVK